MPKIMLDLIMAHSYMSVWIGFLKLLVNNGFIL